MAPIDERSIILWIGIVALVLLVSVAGMILNRIFTYRAHRRALDEWRLKAVSAEYRENAGNASTHNELKNIPICHQE